MKKTLYLECTNGISGDMFVGAMLDLGADQQKLLNVLKTIPEQGFSIEISRVKKAGIDCCDFNVRLEEDNHDHDMEYLYGNKEIQEEHHHHHHRHYTDVADIINKTEMSEHARNLALKIFSIIADAESKAHAIPKEEVHFHEVGAIDSIVDVISAAACYDDLGFTDAVVTALHEGTGTVRCQHGILSVPVPAVLNICQANALPLSIMDVKGEYVTPTGAAIAAAIRTEGKLPASFTVKKTGYGAGKRITPLAGYARAMWIEDTEEIQEGEIWKLEANMDDCTGEQLGYVLDELMHAGAGDVHFIPVTMKKSRPGILLTVICAEDKIQEMESIIFHDTTTIGIRRVKMQTTYLAREVVDVKTEYGTGKAKRVSIAGKDRYYPEYESVVTLAKKSNISYQEAYQSILKGTIDGFE